MRCFIQTVHQLKFGFIFDTEPVCQKVLIKNTIFKVQVRDFEKKKTIITILAKEMERLSELELLRDQIIANSKNSNSSHVFGAMCESDLNLMKGWHWNRLVNSIFQ